MKRPQYLTAHFGVLAFHAALHAQASDAKPAAGPPFVTDREFKTPPASARPRVWWHWLNGNITKDGIRKDLEWMTRVGIGGMQNFDAAWQTPQIVEHRPAYMAPEWNDAFRYAVGPADQKGLEPYMRPDANHIAVKVANLWVNRLIGDAQPGAEQVGFTTTPTYLPDAPLRPAGLLGPVTLLKK